TLGWFDNGSVPSFRSVSPTVPNSSYKYRCYLYVDDVSVTPVSGPDTVYTTHDSLYCQNLSTAMELKSKAQFGEYSWSTGSLKDTIQVSDTGVYWCVGVSGCV